MTEDTKKELKDFNSALGLGVEVDCFNDGQPRTLYPITLKDYPEFISCLQSVSADNIAQSFFIDNGEGLRNLIDLCFVSEQVDEVLDNIDANNFKTFIEQIFEANGISLKKQNGSDDKKK